MALHRGIQSAIFYYLACTPCAEGRVRKRRRQETERNRLERAALEAHMPGLYVHPEPSATNPYWQTEIEAGPIPSRTRKKTADMKKANSTRSNLASSISVEASLSMERSDSALSGLAPSHRNDEAVWGPTTSDVAGRARSGTGSLSRDGLPTRPARAIVKDSRTRSYNHPQHAAINDLHPPTTRKIHSKEEIKWMMQPPPVPEVMSGKTSLQPSRTSSVHRRPERTNSDSAPSEGHIRERSPSFAYAHAPTVKHSPESELKQSSYLTVPSRPHELRLTRSRTLPVRHAVAEMPQTAAHASARKTLLPVQALDDIVLDSRATTRPALSQDRPDSAIQHDMLDGYENDDPSRTGPLHSGQRSGTKTEMNTLTSPTATMATKDHTLRSSPLVETHMFVSSKELADEHGLDDLTKSDAFESWTKPDFEFPQWIHDHTKREVRERWSFDV